MKIIWAITTYNRLKYLKQCIESWERTHNPKHQWTLIACDDGSNDGTKKYLKSHGFKIFKHNRRGVHHQTNTIIKHCSKIDFDITFKTDDDITFKQKTWDDRYIEAITETGCDHLNFHDLKWKRKKHKRATISHPSALIENKAVNSDTQGACWTFTPQVIEKVGYFDLQKFGACGFGHRDYTFRCCRAGFNVLDSIYDIKDSNKYLGLIKKDYQSASEDYFKIWNENFKTWNIREKKALLRTNRVYVPYNTIHYNILGQPLYRLF